MLEVVNAPGFARQGQAKLDFASAYQGYITYIKGVDADGTVVVSCPNSSAQSHLSYYPIKKLRMEEDLSDTSDAVDKLTKGERVIYFEGGEYWTDRITRDGISFGAALPAATAEARGLAEGLWYGVDQMVVKANPMAALYVSYWGAVRGELTTVAVGSSAAYYTTRTYAPAIKFRLMEVYGSTAASIERGTAIKARFKVLPGFSPVLH